MNWENDDKNESVTGTAKFPLGMTMTTIGALQALADSKTASDDLLTRHRSGDWGDLCAGDKHLNDDALKHGDRLLSAYVLPTGVKVWVITEWDRSATTLLLPDEY